MIREIRLMFMRKLHDTRRNPVLILRGLVSPILYLVCFAPLLQGLNIGQEGLRDHVLTYFIPGMLILTVFTGGLYVGFSTVGELRTGIIERFRVTPISRFAILFGMILENTFVMLASALVLVIIGIPFGFRFDPLGMFLIFILLILLVSAAAYFSHAIAFITKREDKIAPLIHVVHTPLTLLSGMMLSMDLAPPWLKIIAHCNPLYYLVKASRHLVVGCFTDPSIYYAFLFMIPITLLMMWWSTKVFNKVIL